MQHELPIWVSILQALATPTIAVAGAIIAYAQFRLANDRFKYDLYDRRYAVFEATMKFLATVLDPEKLLENEAKKFKRIATHAVFLLDQETCDYLDTIWLKATRYVDILSSLSGGETSKEKSDTLRNEKEEIEQWLSGQFTVAVDKFRPSLSYRHPWPNLTWFSDA